MASPLPLPLSICFPATTKELEEEEQSKRAHQINYDKLISSLPSEQRWPYTQLYQYKGFWLSHPSGLHCFMAAQQHFTSRPDDILLSTIPKVGTTWLKALAFATLNRNDNPFPQSSLLTHNPHQCVPFIEHQLYADHRIPNIDALPSPRLLATHTPYSLLPTSVVALDCKIIYMCRNPRDTFVSMWHFLQKTFFVPVALDHALECFCMGVHPVGPFWDHVLEYWKESLRRPQKVLFLMYEELKRDPVAHLKKLAEFMGCAFSVKEEREGVLEKILELCSFEKLSRLEVNRTGVTEMMQMSRENEGFFRRGKVGDWANHLSPEMVERLDRVMEEKFSGSGLSFQASYAPN